MAANRNASVSMENSTNSAMADSSLIPQPLPTPYVDRSRLLRKLRQRFGTNSEGNYNFKVQVSNSHSSCLAFSSLNLPPQLRLNHWTVFVPETLTDVRKTFATPNKKFQLMRTIVRNTGSLWLLRRKLGGSSAGEIRSGEDSCRATLKKVFENFAPEFSLVCYEGYRSRTLGTRQNLWKTSTRGWLESAEFWFSKIVKLFRVSSCFWHDNSKHTIINHCGESRDFMTPSGPCPSPPFFASSKRTSLSPPYPSK